MTEQPGQPEQSSSTRAREFYAEQAQQQREDAVKDAVTRREADRAVAH